MRSWSIAFALLLMLALSGSARAEGVNNLLVGINGLLTFAADPVMGVISPPEDFEELPGHQVTGRVLGLFSGTLMGGYRAMMASVDIIFTPMWVFPTLSPQARFELIPGLEFE